MKIIYVNQCFFTYFLITFHVSRAATHWVVTEDGKIHTQDDSMYQMRRPYDLMALLQQEKRVDVFSQIKNQLLTQKEEIETDNFSDNDEDVEQLVYLTNPDCLRAGKPLIEFDLYVGTLVFAYPKLLESSSGKAFPDDFPVNLLRTSSLHHANLPFVNNLFYDSNKNLYTIACANTTVSKVPSDLDISENGSTSFEPIVERIKYGPICSDYLALDFSMTTFEHLPSIRDRKQLNIDPENDILQVIGMWRTYEDFGKDLRNGLKQNSTSWLLYTLASFYWRGAGQAEQAIECARRALHCSPFVYRPIPQLSLATILHRARASEEAAIVLHGAIDIYSDIPHAHYTLGNIYATLVDYNKSVICYENVLKLAPQFTEVKARKSAVLCHSSIENALKTQHDNLQKTLDELKDYQKQQELWISYHRKLRAEQAPPSVLLEQRMHYREFKTQQKRDASQGENSNENNGNGKNAKNPTTKEIFDAIASEDLLLPANAKLHIKFNADGSLNGGSLLDKIVIEMDELKNSDELLCELEKQQKTRSKASQRKNRDDSLSDSVSSANNESNEEDSSSGGGSSSSSPSSGNKQRHVPLGANSKY